MKLAKNKKIFLKGTRIFAPFMDFKQNDYGSWKY